ncbi:hypothetical protein PFBG_05893 [Plasmodium falciparum 7G8]|uniref:Erythrocyte membrane protein 1 n=4 Tax=Plasmodium falciparum TaxID=5833 RepID=W7F3P4_PLAF8|nr:hypothetical protein PFBG_05893 [Plasmodium falciparum 7G8]
MEPGLGARSNKSAKEVLDEFGQQVYDEIVKSEAETYKNKLKGNLTDSSILGERARSNKTCDLIKDKGEKLLGARDDPCKELSGKMGENRFSDTLGGQCTDGKMRSGGIGACAPYRRLHLCSHNLESIDTTSTTHKLLAEVCMAANYEAQSLIRYHGKHKETNNESQLCTVLARSFADIGDIIRRRDLYRGNDEEKKQRDKLEENLKKIFKNIKSENTELSTLTTEKVREYWWYANRATIWEAITCNAKAFNYFRNTCNGGEGTKGYCRCNGDKPDDDKANIDPPTYFDYVPQYLRWFEEWAEDFCRLRKHKLKDAIQKCRKPNGNDRYCDLNKYDCAQTIRGDERFVEDEDCKDCQYSCAHFVKWIDNQKLEFEKQREKYTSEMEKYTNGITSSKRKKPGARGATTKVYDGYEKKFYDKFKTGYNNVDSFLEKLNKETTCTNINDTEEGKIEFKNVKRSSPSGDDSNKTFYRTTYCEACPWCGAHKKGGGNGKWTPKDDGGCKPGIDYKNYEDTPIPILTGDKTKSEIVERYTKFCKNNGKNGVTSGATGTPPAASGDNSDNVTTGYCGGTNNSDSSLCEKWTCYYKKKENNDGKKAINFCVLQDGKENTKDQKDKSYNVFFWDWVYYMLHDSLDWRKQLGNCINKDKDNTCRNNKKCNRECDCFLKWVKQKEKEWKQIIVHFYKQEDIRQEGLLGSGLSCPDFVLNYLLNKDELLKNIKDTHANAKDIEHIEKMLQQAGVASGVGTFGVGGNGAMCGTGANSGENKNTKIDKLLQHEKGEAQECLRKQDDCNKQKQQERGRSHSDSPPGTTVDPTEEDEEEKEEEEEEEEEVTEQGSDNTQPEEVKDKDAVVDGESSTAETTQQEASPSQNKVNPCDIVSNLFSNTTKFSDACTLKYVTGKNYGWKCVTSGEKSGDNTGGLCIPPRRRRLYVGKLEQWAKKQLKSQVDGTTGHSQNGESSGQAQTQGDTTTQSDGKPASQDPSDKLREAFIQSAAVETFFLWDRYKKEKKPPVPQDGAAAAQQLSQLPDGSSDTLENSDDPQTQLKSGTIPPSFLRQMFYTLGDYRDIFFGKNDIVIGNTGTGSAKDEMADKERKIKETIDKVFPNNDSSSAPPGSPQTQRSDKRTALWGDFAQYIWNGMIYALTYTDSGEKGELPKEDESLKSVLWDKATGKPKGKYGEYDKVELDEDTGTEAKNKTPKTASSSGDNNPPKLSDFVEIPTYFRYLHEWGQNFCKERKKRLEKIEGECMDEDGNKQYSGDGEYCEEIFSKQYNVLPDLSSRCAKPCRLYKTWIQRKGKEFDEQQNAYNNQKVNCETESESSKQFCRTLGASPTIAAFLQKLGPCKIENESAEGNEKDKLDFRQPGQTFKEAHNCAPCSQFTVDCKNGNCGSDPKLKCNGEIITAQNFETWGQHVKEFVMRVSDNDTNEFEHLQACGSAGIFKGIKENRWECRNVCGYVVCKPENVNGEAKGKHIIQIRALVKRWVEYFFEDYNKIKKKLNPCTKNDQESTCIKNCVEKWVDQKRKEWKEITERFKDQYKNDNSDDDNVRSFLETLIPQIGAAKDKDKVIKLSVFENSKGCCVDASAQNKNGEYKDAIECMIKKLEEKAKKCEENHAQTSGSKQCTQSTSQQTLDLDDQIDEDPENKVGHPQICKGVLPKEEEGDKCEPASPEPKETESTTSAGEETQTNFPEPPEEKAPAPAPESPAPPPLPSDNTSDILKTTIPFGIALALTSIALLFLKVTFEKHMRYLKNIRYIMF